MREILSYDDRYTCSLVVAFGYPKIESSIKEIDLGEDQSYYLDDHRNYVVPKYKLDEIVRRI